MKKKIAGWMLAGLLSGAPAMAAHQADTLDVLFWNLENFFDYRDQGTSESDAEFSGRGLRHWTKKRFLTKCNAVAKTLLWTAGQTGRMPDVVAVAEVENRFVLKQLLRETALRKQPWGIAHYESPDHRGIDVGLLWRTDRWDTVCTRACHVFGPDGAVLPTRDILLVQLQRRAAPAPGIAGGSGTAPAVDRWAILVDHHPSKYGGSSSAWRREAAVDRLRELCDSLRAAGWSRIVATGDFNDTADAPLFQRLDALENLALPLAARGQGTIRFNGRWELIDLFFLSNVLTNSTSYPNFLITSLMASSAYLSFPKCPACFGTIVSDASISCLPFRQRLTYSSIFWGLRIFSSFSSMICRLRSRSAVSGT